MQTIFETHTPARWARWNKILAGGERLEIGGTPKDAVYQRDRLVIYKYRRSTPARFKTPVLLVYSLINRPSVLDLRPGRSVVERLLEGGYDVYLLDWGIPDALDQFNSLETYVCNLLRNAVRQVCRHSQEPQISILGYCMGGTLAAMYTALYPARVKNLMLMGTPLVFRSNELLYQWGCDERICNPQKIVDGWAMAPAWSFEGYSLLTIDAKPKMMAALYDKLGDEDFVDSYVAMEQWVTDNIPMAGTVYVEFVTSCFHQNRLIEGRLSLGGRTVDLTSITCPVLIIAGSNDHLVPPETTTAADLPFANGEALVFPSGHIGLSVSRNSHRKLWPKVCNWLESRSLSCNTAATRS